MDLSLPAAAVAQGGLDAAGQLWGAGSVLLWIALLFGARQGSGLPGYELLRSWTLGAFSRFDAVFLLLWLAAMFFRICVLAHILRLLWEKFRGRSVCEVSP